MHPRREEDPQAFIPAAGKCFMCQFLACQHANIDELFRLRTLVRHEVAPVIAGWSGPLVAFERAVIIKNAQHKR